METSKISATPDPHRYLRWTNPRLIDLRARYNALCPQLFSHPLWTEDYVAQIDLLRFRGDNVFVPQTQGTNMTDHGYSQAIRHIKRIDKWMCLDRLYEDGAFGARTLVVDGVTASRELIDSIVEFYFLEDNLQISSKKNLTVLDIGAGYGRMAHRLIGLLPNLQRYTCVDAAAVSTFLCEFYTRFRGLSRTRVLPMDMVARSPEVLSADLAINIHSFSECSADAISWWMQLLAMNRVPYLMVVPNAHYNGGRKLLSKEGEDFLGIIQRFGYRLDASRPKYILSPVQDTGVNPTYHYLFHLG